MHGSRSLCVGGLHALTRKMTQPLKNVPNDLKISPPILLSVEHCLRKGIKPFPALTPTSLGKPSNIHIHAWIVPPFAPNAPKTMPMTSDGSYPPRTTESQHFLFAFQPVRQRPPDELGEAG